jgi:hypothetical protein
MLSAALVEGCLTKSWFMSPDVLIGISLPEESITGNVSDCINVLNKSVGKGGESGVRLAPSVLVCVDGLNRSINALVFALGL